MDASILHVQSRSPARQSHAARAVDWNGAGPQAHAGLVHQYIEEHARRSPDTIAAMCEGKSITYGEMNSRANQLARYLRLHGIRPDETVGLCMERGLDMVVALVGIFKAGGAYLPLDPSYPADMLAYMLEDAAPRTVLIQERFRQLLPAGRCAVVGLDSHWEAIATQARDDLDPASLGLAPDCLAYVIYTSGSTGRPKGVMIEHRNVVNLWRALEQDIYSQHPECHNVAVNASLAFDSSVKQLVQLLAGRTLFPVPQTVRMDAVELLGFIGMHHIDSLDCTPTQLTALIAAGLLRDPQFAPQIMLLGGEHIDEATWSKLAGSTRPVFYNVYGPTECTVDASIARVSESATPTIGRPIANACIYVLDEHGRPAAIGADGEIYISGAGVGRGYLNRTRLTAERFVPDPFVVDATARMYRTGDLGRWRADGCIEYLGRNDDQVKIRGFRIEPAEIEAQLRRDPRVAAAVVVARQDVPGEKRLIGYVVAASLQPVTGRAAPASPRDDLSGQLQAELTRRLPQHMVPATIVLLDRLPVTASGKVDRRALPAPSTVSQQEWGYCAPSTSTEAQLCTLWQEVLGTECIGVDDSFFDLSGHSMTAMRLSAAVSETCGVRFPFVAVFEHSTVRRMAAAIEQLRRDAPELDEGTL